MAIKVGMISLGCSKNQVDAERLLAILAGDGFTICNDMTECDAVIVNTCGFIEDAKKESIDTILELSLIHISPFAARGTAGRYPGAAKRQIRRPPSGRNGPFWWFLSR